MDFKAEDEGAGRAPRRARGIVPDSIGGLCLVAASLAALLAAGCAPAPIYLSHHGESGGGEATVAERPDVGETSGLILTPPLDDLTANRIISRFGPRNANGGPGSTNHQGVDIKAAPGEAVRAAAAGTVIFSGQERGYGNLVILDHGNGITTYYAHLLQTSVRRGDRVNAGAAIGRAGKDGTATTTHLHFELRRGAKPVDPMPYLMACLHAA